MDSKQNGYLLNQISVRFANGEEPAGIWEIPDFYRKLDAATVQDAAKQYLDTKSFIKVSLFPEKK